MRRGANRRARLRPRRRGACLPASAEHAVGPSDPSSASDPFPSSMSLPRALPTRTSSYGEPSRSSTCTSVSRPSPEARCVRRSALTSPRARKYPTQSRPPPPSRRSVPPCPTSLSREPPPIESSPDPFARSLPRPPNTTSSPPRARITSFPCVPCSLSGPSVPVMVAWRAKQSRPRASAIVPRIEP